MNFFVTIERKRGRVIMGTLEVDPRGCKVTQHIGPYRSFKRAEGDAAAWLSCPGVTATWVEPLEKPATFSASKIPF